MMNKREIFSDTTILNPRTARAITAILSQTATDAALRELNQTEGRNQSEQATHLGTESPFLRDIYERGATVVDNVLTVPRENLTLPPEVEITTARHAATQIARLTGDEAKGKELAAEFIEMANAVAGKTADGASRIKTFQWLYRSLEGKEDLLGGHERVEDASERGIAPPREAKVFHEKWQEIIELAEMMRGFEPKDSLPENSIDEEERQQEYNLQQEPDENQIAAEIYEQAIDSELSEQNTESQDKQAIIGFERIELASDLPPIPLELFNRDFEKLLTKLPSIDSQLEAGVNLREVLEPFKKYVVNSRLDNELRLVEEEYAKQFAKTNELNITEVSPTRFVATGEELRELKETRESVAALEMRQVELQNRITTQFTANEREKAQSIINSRIPSFDAKTDETNQQLSKPTLTEDEIDLTKLFAEERETKREIGSLNESINAVSKNFQSYAHLENVAISESRKQELLEKAAAQRFPLSTERGEIYPQPTSEVRSKPNDKVNIFEVNNPTEYLFVRRAAQNQFEVLREREIKNERSKFKNNQSPTKTELAEHRSKIYELKIVEPKFSYKLSDSNRVFQGLASERAVAGYKFVQDYAHYQLKQPDVRLRHTSKIYRDFAARLDDAKSVEDVTCAGFDIRAENHRATSVWKTIAPEERASLGERQERPLQKREMAILFLETTPRHYTTAMTLAKYDFAHYSEAKVRMTAALEAGRLAPSAEARKLVESLESRLNRRGFETQQKATKHFFQSLKTENEKLAIKNQFDHQEAYSALPPHEKDWVYQSATKQRENLEYKIAFDQAKTAEHKIEKTANANLTTAAGARLKNDFAAGTLWHQAALLSETIKNQDVRQESGLSDKTLQTIGVLIHNQNQNSNLKVAEWLARQNSIESEKAAEVLATFAGATRQIADNRLTVTVKINSENQVSTDAYQKLFERYFPESYKQVEDFRQFQNQPFRLEQTRRDAQQMILDEWKHEANAQIDLANAPPAILESQERINVQIERITQAQIEARRASEVRAVIVSKYAEKLKTELTGKNDAKISVQQMNTAIELALSPEKTGELSRAQKSVFERVKNKIIVSDFEKFGESSRRVEQRVAEINQSFETIAGLTKENVQRKSAATLEQNSQILDNQQVVTLVDAKSAKPTTLSIYERELLKQEKAIFRRKVDQMLETGKLSLNDLETKTPTEVFSKKERAEIKLEAGERTRDNLEPKELSAKQQSVSAKLQTAALATSAALEKAHASYLENSDSKILQETFTVLDKTVVALKKDRQGKDTDYRFTNFKAAFKRDLATLYRNTEKIEDSRVLTAMTNGLLINNLDAQNLQSEKIGISQEKLGEISRTIALAISDNGNREREQGTTHRQIISQEPNLPPDSKNNFAVAPEIELQQASIKVKQFEKIR